MTRHRWPGLRSVLARTGRADRPGYAGGGALMASTMPMLRTALPVTSRGGPIEMRRVWRDEEPPLNLRHPRASRRRVMLWDFDLRGEAERYVDRCTGATAIPARPWCGSSAIAGAIDAMGVDDGRDLPLSDLPLPIGARAVCRREFDSQSGGPAILAKHDGYCRGCDGEIQAGVDLIHHSVLDGWVHEDHP